MIIKRESVGKSFSTPKTVKDEPRDRAAGLAGLLPPRAPGPVTSTPTPAPAIAVVPPAFERVQERDTAQQPSVTPDVYPESDVKPDVQPDMQATVKGGVATIGVYLTPLTLERAREATLERRITYTDLLVEAFDHVTDAQLTAEFAPIAPLVQGKVMPTRVRRRRGTAGIQMNLRLSREQREWLDGKVVDLGAPSRSALVAEALRLHLNPAY
jgi:hypothetical protein